MDETIARLKKDIADKGIKFFEEIDQSSRGPMALAARTVTHVIESSCRKRDRCALKYGVLILRAARSGWVNGRTAHRPFRRGSFPTNSITCVIVGIRGR